MAVVQGVKEKVHLPIYDSITVEAGKQLGDDEKSNVLKFFVDVEKKTKLQTNLQSASLLPHYNTFEARALRVVISDLPPEFPEDRTAENEEELEVSDEDGQFIDRNGVVEGTTTPTAFNPALIVSADVELGLDRLVQLLKQAQESEEGFAELGADDPDVALTAAPAGAGGTAELSDDETHSVAIAGGTVFLSVQDIEELMDSFEDEAPPAEQLSSNNGAGTLIGKLIYNTVTTLYVGEKIMIQAPTWLFPAGAGPYSEAAAITTHGEPSPTATFRFAEPVFIDKQQNFRVEIEVPDSEMLKEIQRIYGPLFIWVFLDGYMTRDVQ